MTTNTKQPKRPPRPRRTRPKLVIPKWAMLPGTYEAIERGERLEPIPTDPLGLAERRRNGIPTPALLPVKH